MPEARLLHHAKGGLFRYLFLTLASIELKYIYKSGRNCSFKTLITFPSQPLPAHRAPQELPPEAGSSAYSGQQFH